MGPSGVHEDVRAKAGRTWGRVPPKRLHLGRILLEVRVLILGRLHLGWLRQLSVAACTRSCGATAPTVRRGVLHFGTVHALSRTHRRLYVSAGNECIAVVGSIRSAVAAPCRFRELPEPTARQASSPKKQAAPHRAAPSSCCLGRRRTSHLGLALGLPRGTLFPGRCWNCHRTRWARARSLCCCRSPPVACQQLPIPSDCSAGRAHRDVGQMLKGGHSVAPSSAVAKLPHHTLALALRLALLVHNGLATGAHRRAVRAATFLRGLRRSNHPGPRPPRFLRGRHLRVSVSPRVRVPAQVMPRVTRDAWAAWAAWSAPALCLSLQGALMLVHAKPTG